MSRFKISVFFFVLCGFILTGCLPTKGTASPEDYMFLAQTSLEGAKVAAMIGRNEAIDDRNFAGCVASEVFVEALGSANKALGKSSMGDDFYIPAVSIDLSECMSFAPAPGPAPNEEVAQHVEAIASVALGAAIHYSRSLLQADCKKGVAVLGVVEYLMGLVKPIANEIALSDGKFEAPEVKVPLSSCSEK